LLLLLLLLLLQGVEYSDMLLLVNFAYDVPLTFQEALGSVGGYTLVRAAGSRQQAAATATATANKSSSGQHAKHTAATAAGGRIERSRHWTNCSCCSSADTCVEMWHLSKIVPPVFMHMWWLQCTPLQCARVVQQLPA
jgi:hypothetical protein